MFVMSLFFSLRYFINLINFNSLEVCWRFVEFATDFADTAAVVADSVDCHLVVGVVAVGQVLFRQDAYSFKFITLKIHVKKNDSQNQKDL